MTQKHSHLERKITLSSTKGDQMVRCISCIKGSFQTPTQDEIDLFLDWFDDDSLGLIKVLKTASSQENLVVIVNDKTILYKINYTVIEERHCGHEIVSIDKTLTCYRNGMGVCLGRKSSWECTLRLASATRNSFIDVTCSTRIFGENRAPTDNELSLFFKQFYNDQKIYRRLSYAETWRGIYLSLINSDKISFDLNYFNKEAYKLRKYTNSKRKVDFERFISSVS